MKFTPVTIDNQTIYIANLSSNGPDSISKRTFTADNIKDAFKPILNLGNALKESIKEISPDEVEISMQLSTFINNNTIFFGLVNAGAEAQIAVKYLWKKSESENDSRDNE